MSTLARLFTLLTGRHGTHTVEKSHEYVIVEFENSVSKTGNPIFLRYDRFYEGATGLLGGQSNESLASTNAAITKLDQAYLIPAYKPDGKIFAQALLADEAMR